MTLVFVLLVVWSGTAMAGGSWFRSIEADIQPGDSVTMVGFSGFASDEPGESFYGYLDLDPDTAPSIMTEETKAELLPLGEITITDGGEGWQTFRLHITFTVPADLAPGYYEFLHCNDPCTTGFGDPQTDRPDGGPASYKQTDLSDPAVADLIGESTAPVELAATGWSPLLLVTGSLLLAGGLVVIGVGRRDSTVNSERYRS